MVYITGDFHGDYKRFNDRNIKKLKKDDYLIICGDFGFIWNDTKKENSILKSIGKKKFTTLFIEGTHDNIDKINSYPMCVFAGANAHHITGNLYHLMRGEIYNLEDKKYFTFGGGESEDADCRVEGESWWSSEIPSEEDIANAIKNLEENNYCVDYIVTHQAPSKIEFTLNGDKFPDNCVGAFLDTILDKTKFKRWYFGSYHTDRFIPKSYISLYTKVYSENEKNKGE